MSAATDADGRVGGWEKHEGVDLQLRVPTGARRAGGGAAREILRLDHALGPRRAPAQSAT
jgi:hypothetical protein